MILTILKAIGWMMVGFWGVFGLCLIWYWVKELFVKTRSRRLVSEAESELRRAHIRKSLDEDMGIEGEGWMDQDSWNDDGREWWLRDQDNLGDR